MRAGRGARISLWSAAFLLAVAPAAKPADIEERTTESKAFGAAKLLIVDNVWGSIDVSGGDAGAVQVDVSKRIRAESPERLEAAKREVRLDMSQSGDTVKLYVDGPFRCDCSGGRSVRMRGHSGYQVDYDFRIRAPRDARVDLYTVNGGRITVTNIEGDFDAQNVNGVVELRGIAGSGRAKTVNGGVTAVFARNPSGASSFETINGDVDVTFRKGLSADVWTGTLHGDVYTDFDVKPLPARVIREQAKSGLFVYRRSGMGGVRIGAGGAEMKLKTLNGNIFIRSN
jgi:hypothetical protein